MDEYKKDVKAWMEAQKKNYVDAAALAVGYCDENDGYEIDEDGNERDEPSDEINEIASEVFGDDEESEESEEE